MDILKQLEAILFLANEELDIANLCRFFNISKGDMLDVLKQLKEVKKDTGINICIEGEKVYMASNPAYGKIVYEFFNPESKPKKLSKAALETLSIIAYRQPITKAEIEVIRGVGADGVLHSLEDKKLVRVCGKLDSIGRPNLYEITENFLKYMGIERVEELPNYEEVKSGFGKIEDK
jgi:segregation and condensation protein B